MILAGHPEKKDGKFLSKDYRVFVCMRCMRLDMGHHRRGETFTILRFREKSGQELGNDPI